MYSAHTDNTERLLSLQYCSTLTLAGAAGHNTHERTHGENTNGMSDSHTIHSQHEDRCEHEYTAQALDKNKADRSYKDRHSGSGERQDSSGRTLV